MSLRGWIGAVLSRAGESGLFAAGGRRRVRRAGSVGVVLALCSASAWAAAGSGWSIEAGLSPPPVPRPFAEFLAVSCVSRTVCVAVGDSGQQPLVERWDGSKWSIQPSPNVAGGALSGVSCASSKACIAVGSLFGAGATSTLVERWNGSSWSILPTPESTSSLRGVSCTSARACVAVGTQSLDRFPSAKTLVERWNGGTWSIERTPKPTRRGPSSLFGVSCITSSACTAVGVFTICQPVCNSSPLVERWNGLRWSIQRAWAGRFAILLTGVSCTSTMACMAVGWCCAALMRPQAERWNGKTWSPEPTPTNRDSLLSSVSCASASACIAVGTYPRTMYGPSSQFPLVERWNGLRWSIQQTPSAYGAGLNGVSCTSETACTAVGAVDVPIWPLAERYSRPRHR